VNFSINTLLLLKIYFVFARKSLIYIREIKTYIKKFELALEENNLEVANELLRKIDKRLKQATLNSVFHKNAASKKVSKLSKKLHDASTQA